MCAGRSHIPYCSQPYPFTLNDFFFSYGFLFSRFSEWKIPHTTDKHSAYRYISLVMRLYHICTFYRLKNSFFFLNILSERIILDYELSFVRCIKIIFITSTTSRKAIKYTIISSLLLPSVPITCRYS